MLLLRLQYLTLASHRLPTPCCSTCLLGPQRLQSRSPAGCHDAEVAVATLQAATTTVEAAAMAAAAAIVATLLSAAGSLRSLKQAH